MRREASGSGASGVDVPGLVGLWGTSPEESVRAHACLYALRTHPGPRRQRGQKPLMARTAPSGSRGVACGDEPRTRRAVAPAECQKAIYLFALAHSRRHVTQRRVALPHEQGIASVQDIDLCLEPGGAAATRGPIGKHEKRAHVMPGKGHGPMA